jgi:hypothetical protein
VRRLVTILRREAAAGYPQHYCTLRMPVVRPGWRSAGVEIPPVSPTGKEPRNFGLHRDKQLAVAHRRGEIIQLPPTTQP